MRIKAMKLPSAGNGGMIGRVGRSSSLERPPAWRERARNLWPRR